VGEGANTRATMAKLIQICASQNDLFGLDSDGLVYQYNFSSKAWIELAPAWDDHGAGSTLAEEKPTRTSPDAAPPRRR
jgi:hypothetical protein